MTTVIQFFGGLVLVLGCIGIGYTGLMVFRLQGDTAVVFALYSVSAIVSGAAMYCLGSIADHLREIRALHERQIEILTGSKR